MPCHSPPAYHRSVAVARVAGRLPQDGERQEESIKPSRAPIERVACDDRRWLTTSSSGEKPSTAHQLTMGPR